MKGDCKNSRPFRLMILALARVAFVVEEDKAFDLIHVSFFGADGVVFDTDGIPDLVEQFFLGWKIHRATVDLGFILSYTRRRGVCSPRHIGRVG